MSLQCLWKRIGAAVFLSIALILPLAGKANANMVSIPQAGSIAPQFVGRDLSGNEVNLSILVKENKAVVINFWGLRCGACIEEMPSLERIFEKNKGVGLTIIGINVDGVNADIIKAHLPSVFRIPSYPLVYDEELKIADMYGLAAAPLTVLIDSKGAVVYTHEGYQKGEEKALEAEIESLIRQ